MEQLVKGFRDQFLEGFHAGSVVRRSVVLVTIKTIKNEAKQCAKLQLRFVSKTKIDHFVLPFDLILKKAHSAR